MPWDGCQLRLLDLASPISAAVIAGGTSESILQPTWTPDGRLLVVSDRTGWWNLYQVNGNDLESLWPASEEFSEAPWLLGLSTFSVLDDHRLVARHGTRTNRLSVLDIRTGSFTEVQLPVTEVEPLMAAHGDRVVVVAQTSNARSVVLLVELAREAITAVRWASGKVCRDEFIPTARIVAVPAQDDRTVPAVIYPPTSPDTAGQPGERPPWLVAVHGGPTSRNAATLQEISFFTSRGFGVVDVDYAGSTGWGRAWRQALYGQWGILDVDDCVAVARWLVDNDLAQDGRVAIRGGSSGGWTAIGALTRSTVFGAAVSLCGVVDATLLAEQTHDFESHYLDWLIGALPEAKTRYVERSPLSHVDAINAPVLLLQGVDDPVVPRSQSEAIVAALQAKGIPYAYLAFEGEQHGLKSAENRVAALQAELSFYGQVFGFDPPDTPKLVIHRPAD
ncbi:MAG: prolyl oligopeptidase family serine peptidase [Frankia sp.]